MREKVMSAPTMYMSPVKCPYCDSVDVLYANLGAATTAPGRRYICATCEQQFRIEMVYVKLPECFDKKDERAK